MPASFPTTVKSFTTKTNGPGLIETGATDIYFASHANDQQDEIVAIETMLQGRPFYNAKAYGALGDGSTNDLAALNAAATAAAGGILLIPKGTYVATGGTVAIPANTTVLAYGVTLQNTSAAATIVSLASGAKVYGLKVRGAGSGTANTAAIPISIVGTVGTYISDVVLEDVYVYESGFYGVLARFAKNVKMRNLKVFDAAYAGVACESVDNVHITDPHIDMDDPVGSSGNAYGIYFSRLSGTLAAQPLSKNCSVKGGLVENVQLWEGLDTHGGQHIVFDSVIVRRCRSAIALGPSANESAVLTWAPRFCVIDGCTLESDVTDGTYSAGISISGVTGAGEKALGNSISATVIRGHGINNSTEVGGISCSDTIGTTINGATTVECSVYAIVMRDKNQAFNINGCTLVDTWGPAGSIAIRVNGANSSGVIDALVVGRGVKTGVNSINGTVINVADDATNFVRIGTVWADPNGLDGGGAWVPIPLIDAGNHALLATLPPLQTAASVALRSGLRVPHGTAPTSPVNGDVWSTTAGLFIRVNGVTKTVTLT